MTLAGGYRFGDPEGWHFGVGLATELFPGAQFVIQVKVREIFPNCGRYIHRYELVERSGFVPGQGRRPPVPGWKRADWACDVLPEGDPARQKP